MCAAMKWENTSINDRVKHILSELYGNNVTAMAKSTFISRSSINNVIGDAQTTPGYDIIRRLLELKNGIISPEWLILGRGEMLKTDNKAGDEVPDLPISAAAGFTADLENGVTPVQCDKLPRIPNIPSYDLTISIRGDSMEPTLMSGDRLAIKKCNNVYSWGAPHVLDTFDGIFVKRIKESDKDIVCISDNPEYLPFNIPKTNIRGIYKIVAIIRLP